MEESQTSRPPTSGIPPIQLPDCIQEVLKFTLLSSIQGRIQTALSNEYCADLLRVDPYGPVSSNSEVTKGVPSYPLYKRLASSFCRSIHFGTLSTAYNDLRQLDEGQYLKKNDDGWDKLFLEKGSVLQRVMEEVNFELHVQEPFFSNLNDGLKTVEGRCAVGKYKRIQCGHFLLFNKCLILQVQAIRQYASFCELLEAEGLEKVLPGAVSIEEGVQIYRNFYSEEKERSNGVLAICLRITTSQPYVVMASMLSELSYAGVQKLLGFVKTIGTNMKLLPPPTSALLSAFVMPHNPQVKSSTMTNGARALAKHANRSSDRYWGALHGSDSDKNRYSLAAITHLLTDCCWLNLHIVPPHGTVFEIRNNDGYGARWSANGTKFIGFLEPYTMDGHSNRWKH